ncbi:MAG: polysaccharide deacetylase family protein [Acidobacteriota bacterium]
MSPWHRLVRAGAVAVASLALVAWSAPVVVRSGVGACKGIALTFDLCPVKQSPGFDEALVRELIDHHIHATFFPSGRWIETHDAQMRELLAVPYFEIGSHGEAHAMMSHLTTAAQAQEMRGPVKTLAMTYGRVTTLFRPPYGDYNADTVEEARREGLTFVLWSVVSGDPDPKLPAARIAAEVETRAHNGSIVIFHANGRGWHTPEVIADVYQHLIVERGMTPLTVSEMLGSCAGHGSAVHH